MKLAALALAVAVLLLCGCGGGNAVGNEAANAPAAPTTDEGKAEALVRAFMQASEAQDQAKCRSMLVKEEREPKDGANFKFNDDGSLKSWSISGVKTDGAEIVVTVESTMKDKPGTTSMPMVVVREDGELRLSMTRTIDRLLASKGNKPAGNAGE